jgi:Kdo2-lipid IVA lauroyltransferase/acyltransferase
MLARLVLALMWLLHFLPLAVLARLGEGLGTLAYWVVVPRRRVCAINLEKCFPELSAGERRDIAREHFRLLGRFVLEHGLIWWGSRERFARLVQFDNWELIEPYLGSPLIIVAPHFLGLDLGGVRITLEATLASIYQKQNNPVFDRRILTGRRRFNPNTQLLSRQDGVRAAVKAIKSGSVLYYLPDLDFGPRDTIFVPFFGVPAATITGVSRLARLTGARVVPCVTRMLPGAQGYRARFYPPWESFPTDDVAADTRRVNAFIEERVREMPAQYYWVHKRFKTRPDGERKFY